METSINSSENYESTLDSLKSLIISESDIIDQPGYEHDVNFKFKELNKDIDSFIKENPNSEALGLIPLTHDEEGDIYFGQETHVIDLRLKSANLEDIHSVLEIMGSSYEGNELFGNLHNFTGNLLKRLIPAGHDTSNPTLRRIENVILERSTTTDEYSGNLYARLEEARVSQGLMDGRRIIESMNFIEQKRIESASKSPNGYQLRFKKKLSEFMRESEEYSVGDRYLVVSYFNDPSKWVKFGNEEKAFSEQVLMRYLESLKIEDEDLDEVYS